MIGRSLFRDRKRFHDYVFEEIRPTFIRTHGPWAEFAAFDEGIPGFAVISLESPRRSIQDS